MSAGLNPTPKPGARAVIGTTIGGRYKIERLLGEGGMGAVYQAEHVLMHKRVALKVLHAEMSRMSEVVARFEREAMAAGNIDHPNVAAATDFGKLEDGSFYLVLEYVEGKSLRELIAKGRLDLVRAMRIMRQIASALARAHSLGIVHRDLKPENVMLVERDGDPDFVKVLDFGIAKVPVGEMAPESKQEGHALTQLGMVYGTPEYMAPEQALGQPVDVRADLYSLGIITYEMIAGMRPFENESKVKLLGMHVTAPIPTIASKSADPSIPPAVEAIIARLLSKESKDRHTDARELIDAIDQAMGFSLSPSLVSVPSMPLPISSPAIDPSPPPPVVKPSKPLFKPEDVNAVLGQIKKHATPKVLAIAAGVFGIFVFVIILMVVVSGSRAKPGVDGGVAAATGGTVSPGNTVSPANVDAHRALYVGYMGKKDYRKAMAEVSIVLSGDPSAKEDSKLLADVKEAALSKDNEPAFSILESQLGAGGIDVLYDFAYGRGYPGPVVTRAQKSLARPEVLALNPTVKVTQDIRNAKGCEAKAAFFDEAARIGDERTLNVLKGFQTTSGCGFAGAKDCWPCMHKDGSLQKAITTIQSRK